MYKGKTVLDSEERVSDLQPNLSLLSKIEARGIIVTAKGKTVDFVSRFFAPQSGIDEDPVTGSAHTTLIPYWSARLGKEIMRAKQLSARGGDLYCRMAGERVVIGGKARLYMVGEIEVS